MTLTACGFHLRGYYPVPPELHTLCLQTELPYDEFTKQLKWYLVANKIQLVDDQKQAPITLKILSADYSQTQTAMGANQQTKVFNLVYNVDYQLLDRNGRALQEPQTIVVSRNYSVTSNQLLGDQTVQSNLVTQMQRDAIYEIMARISSKSTIKAIYDEAY